MDNTARMKYIIYALVSFVVLIGFLVFLPEWFWVVLPFLFTSLAKAFDVL